MFWIPHSSETTAEHKGNAGYALGGKQTLLHPWALFFRESFHKLACLSFRKTLWHWNWHNSYRIPIWQKWEQSLEEQNWYLLCDSAMCSFNIDSVTQVAHNPVSLSATYAFFCLEPFQQYINHDQLSNPELVWMGVETHLWRFLMATILYLCVPFPAQTPMWSHVFPLGKSTQIPTQDHLHRCLKFHQSQFIPSNWVIAPRNTFKVRFLWGRLLMISWEKNQTLGGLSFQDEAALGQGP